MRKPIIREPKIFFAQVAELSVHGVWQPQTTTFFDVVQVVDLYEKFYMHMHLDVLDASIEHAKKQKYSQSIHASFTCTICHDS